MIHYRDGNRCQPGHHQKQSGRFPGHNQGTPAKVRDINAGHTKMIHRYWHLHCRHGHVDF